jgi:hypothetical protein
MQVWGMIGWSAAVLLVCHNQGIQLWYGSGTTLQAWGAMNHTRFRILAATTVTWAVAVPILYRIATHHVVVATMAGLISVRSPTRSVAPNNGDDGS